MNLIDRAKNMLLAPKTEWPKVNAETGSMSTLLPSYTMPLAAIGAATLMISLGVIGINGYTSFKGGAIGALFVFLCVVITVVVSIFVADGLATTMGAQKNINKSAQWIIYGFTPLYVVLLLGIIPSADSTLRWVIMIAGFAFSAYVMFLGATVMKGAAADKAGAYTIVVIVIAIVLYIVLDKISAKIITNIMTSGRRTIRYDFDD
jgi:hypothetical protein